MTQTIEDPIYTSSWRHCLKWTKDKNIENKGKMIEILKGENKGKMTEILKGLYDVQDI